MEHLFHHPQDEFSPRSDGQLFEQPVQMGMGSVLRNVQSPGNPHLREIVENALNDLQLPVRNTKRMRDLKPSLFAKQ